MTQTPLDIERVVREVLAELKGATATQSAVPGLSSSVPSTAIKQNVAPGSPNGADYTVGQANRGTHLPSNNGELILSTRLVTMEEIDGRLAGIRQVVVTPQAVVTPAVRDALRQRNIALSRDSTMVKTATATLRLFVVAAGAKTDPELMAGALTDESVNVECYSTKCLLDATDRLAAELAKTDTLGLLLTPHTAAAVCLANRLSGVRAVLGNNTGGLAADLGAIGANLLVVDPQKAGMYKLSQMAGEFCRGGIRSCPDVFRKRLM
jgi:hypothetical protein